MQRPLFLAFATLTLSLVSGYPWFQNEIPNGGRVPHPCNSSSKLRGNRQVEFMLVLGAIRSEAADRVPQGTASKWDGVGHLNAAGGGDRNPFGIAFKAAGTKWTKELCEADSDEDGVFNGAELGDPECTWSKGDTPSTEPTGHPGVCEPVGSAKCISFNKWQVCEQKEFECAGIHEAGIKEWELKFPSADVPAQETNYFCMLFELPHKDKDYHVVADQPLIDNRNTIHHMLVYACPPDLSQETLDLLKQEFSTPTRCSMLAQSTCGFTIGGWTVGGIGDCYDDIDAGTRVGLTSYKFAILEMHWNNPNLEAGWSDASGMKFYLSPNLRTYDLGVLVVGQMGIKIPPNSKKHTESSVCSSRCTDNQLSSNINIVSAGLHMHYAGSKAYLELYKQDGNITLAADEPFRYDSPQNHNHNPAVVMEPGDELVTTCIFNTEDRQKFVYYGDATSDEMCFTYVTYYPKTDFIFCVHFGEAELCNELELERVGDCNTKGLGSDQLWETLYMVNITCDRTGRTCRQECMDLLTSGDRACLRGDAKKYVETGLSELGLEYNYLLLASRSCDAEILQMDEGDYTATGSRPMGVKALLIVAIAFATMIIH